MKIIGITISSFPKITLTKQKQRFEYETLFLFYIVAVKFIGFPL